MIVPLWTALPALAVGAMIGWGLDRALRWELERAGALAWAARAAAGLSLGVAALLHPIAALALAGTFIGIRRCVAEGPTARERTGGALVVLGAATVLALLRPPAPLYWDEHVWLAKVRMGALDLRAAALDPASDLVPRGYPIAGSLAEVLLAAGRDDVPAALAGAAALLLLSLSLALAVLPARARVAWALALATVPLVWVHARSAYLDVPVGLFALAIGAGLARRARWATVVAALAAFLVAGCKDEGLVHALSLAAAHVAVSGERRREAACDATIVAICALVPALTWRALLAAHGVRSEDHAPEAAGLAHAGAILGELARAAWDLRSWGLAWPLALGALIVTRARGLGASWIAQVAALVLALLAGSERLAAFALDGSLVNRFWIQLAPLAALVVVEALAPRSLTSRISKTALGIHS